jgi:hypothetical protein
VAPFTGCGVGDGGDGVVVVKLALAMAGHHREDPEVSVAHDGLAPGARTGSATATACGSAAERSSS